MGFKTSLEFQRERELAWNYLQNTLPPELLQAPHLDWSQVDPKSIRYLYNEARELPWFYHLAFLLAILTCHTKLDRRTIENRCYRFHSRLRVLFLRYEIVSIAQWNPSEHIVRYLNDSELPDSLETRQEFLRSYSAVIRHTATYLRSLPAPKQGIYQKWMFPPLPLDLYHSLSRRGTLAAEREQRRKTETDAIIPHFARIRGESQLRWNQLKRLRDKYREAVTLVQSGQEALPLSFSYEEKRLGLSLHFRLWDRYSFFETYKDTYAASSKKEYKRRRGAFAPEKNLFFLEFLHAKRLQDGAIETDALLWFGDLLRYDLLSTNPVCGTEEEIQRKQAYLKTWGYGTEESEEMTSPFHAYMSGLLAWPMAHERFLKAAEKRAKGMMFLVEPLYAAATFGLAALDFFTTTGARSGELIQLSLDQDCLYTLEVEGKQRFLVRLVPKNSDQPANYVVSAQTLSHLERVGGLLQEHYQLQPGEHIPHVQFSDHNGRSHCFTKPRPYLFQYSNKHLSAQSINACLRFLLHGLAFETTEGKLVKMKAHMLRHAFATHIHQVEAVPLDVIAVILHQKNIQVTAYYAAPPWQQVLATANSLLDKFATHLGSLEEAFVRAPAELQRQLEDAKAQVGSLNKIPGGDCTCHALCPISFACTGCVYNVPDPDREDEIIEQEQWAFIRLDQVKKRGQGPEIVKMQALVQRCQVTRHEMQLMRTYRKDETYEPTLRIE